MWTDGQTDRHDEDNSSFSQFEKSPKRYSPPWTGAQKTNVLKSITNCLLNNKQRRKLNLYGGHYSVFVTDRLRVTFNTKLNLRISSYVLQLPYIFKTNLYSHQVY